MRHSPAQSPHTPNNAGSAPGAAQPHRGWWQGRMLRHVDPIQRAASALNCEGNGDSLVADEREKRS
jgi:hypothetical protein